MVMFACATHWYVSGLFTVPTVLVGGWSWWSSRRTAVLGERDESLDGDESLSDTAGAHRA